MLKLSQRASLRIYSFQIRTDRGFKRGLSNVHGHATRGNYSKKVFYSQSCTTNAKQRLQVSFTAAKNQTVFRRWEGKGEGVTGLLRI